MIKRYVIGEPIESGAVENKPEIEAIDKFDSESEVIDLTDSGLTISLSSDDIVYGLGENVRGMNKRGWKYISNCSDEPHHLETTHSLYAAHNFLIINGKNNIGVFIDTPEKVIFDIGYTKLNEMVITPDSMNMDVYLILGESPDAIVHEFRELIGRSYVPPMWGLGYGQSRWSYLTSDEVRMVAKSYRDMQLPIDSIYLDIDYMERFKDFTINPESFGDFDELVKEMKELHIHLVPIIDAAVKIEDGYDVYEEGKAGGYFCKDEDGNDFTAGVWPGRCHFPDTLNSEARAWFGEKYRRLTDRGIDGFWNDMNEPALFYTDKGMEKFYKRVDEMKSIDLDVDSFFELQEITRGLCNNPDDYKSFYHNYDGKIIRHDKVHNIYGYNMTRAAGEAFEKISPDKRILMFSRSSSIGAHRYGGIWQGDNMSFWLHIKMNFQMMPALNMCGFMYTGADIGGFGMDTTEDMLIRWLQMAIFFPLLRNHSIRGSRRQELYLFDNTDIFRGILKLRYMLIPYLYSELVKTTINSEMMFIPLGFEYRDDEIARHTEDQMFVGESVMLAPIFEQNAIGRTVYIPEDGYMLIRYKVSVSADTDEDPELLEKVIYNKGHHYISMPIDEICFFIRPNSLLPLCNSSEWCKCSEIANIDVMTKIVNATCGEGCGAEESGNGNGNVSYMLYTDDGLTKDIRLDRCVEIRG